MPGRKVYLDWLRGVAVIVMVGGARERRVDPPGGSRPQPVHGHDLHCRPGGAAVPVPRGAHAFDGGIGARVESRSCGGRVDGPAARAASVRAGFPVSPAIPAARLGRADQLPQGRHPQRDGRGDDRRGAALGRVAASVDADRAVRDRDDRRGDEHAAGSRGGSAGGLTGCDRGLHPAAAGPHQLRPVSMGGVSAGRSHRRRAGVCGANGCAGAAAAVRPAVRGPGRHRRGLHRIAAAVDLSGRELLDQLTDVLLHAPRLLCGHVADRTRHRPLPCLRASSMEPLLLRAGCSRPRHCHARQVLTVRVLDSRRNGVRRALQAAQARLAARVVAARRRWRCARCSTRS